MSVIQGFKFTHSKRSDSRLVGVVERAHGKVSFAYSADGQFYSLDEADFRKRFLSLA
jgi:hypothetical protein